MAEIISITEEHAVRQNPHILAGDGESVEDITLSGTSIQRPGTFAKCVDEILTNTYDHHLRDPTMTQLRVWVKDNTLIVYNDGKGMSLSKLPDPTTGKITDGPERAFGKLNSGSQYKDKTNGSTGQNGIGAKLANFLSLQFSVRVMTDTEVYQRIWTKDFPDATEPEQASKRTTRLVERRARTATDTFPGVMIQFVPDLVFFKLDKIPEDWIENRVKEIAACMTRPIQVTYQDKLIPSNSFIHLWPSDVACHTIKGVTAFMGVANSNREVSFVNSSRTYQGGIHVEYVFDKLRMMVKNKLGIEKIPKASFATTRARLALLLNVHCQSPIFDGQDKVKLISYNNIKRPKWELTFPDAFVAEVAELYQELSLKKKKKKEKKGHQYKMDLNSNAGFTDATGAGKRTDCVLIIVEGISAAGLPIRGRDKIPEGRKRFGVLAMKGKPKNLRGDSGDKLYENAAWNNICVALGLDTSLDYSLDENFNKLRYSQVLIMTDQDVDGAHIKGLILNNFHKVVPTLYSRSNFLSHMYTPVYALFDRNNKLKHTFTSMAELEQFEKSNPNHGLRGKYYKGLASSDASMAEYYFSTMAKFVQSFSLNASTDQALMDACFATACTNARKDAISRSSMSEASAIADVSAGNVSVPMNIKTYVGGPWMMYSIYSNIDRGIPDLRDGLIVARRKILTAVKRGNITKPIKVASLMAQIMRDLHYHHGDAALTEGISLLATTYTGSICNLNYLSGDGMFGDRIHGKSSIGAARYVSVKKSPVFDLILRSEDDKVLPKQMEEGAVIEPKYYAPIIPMLLVNGQNGIGTGFASNFPKFSPLQVTDWVLRKLEENTLKFDLKPWYRGFTGEITSTKNAYKSHGRYTIHPKKVEISELPVGVFTNPFMAKCNTEIKDKKKVQWSWFKKVVNHSGPDDVQLTMHLSDDRPSDQELDAFLRKLLVEPIKVTLAVVLNESISVANDLAYIADFFMGFRFNVYVARLKAEMFLLDLEINKVSNQLKYISLIESNTIKIDRSITNAVLLEQIQRHQLWAQLEKPEFGENGDPIETKLKKQPYKYLTDLKLTQMTMEGRQDLESKLAHLQEKRDIKSKEQPIEVWRKELLELRSKLIE